MADRITGALEGMESDIVRVITNRKNIVNVFSIIRSRPGISSKVKNVCGVTAVNLSISRFAHLLRKRLAKKVKKITKTIIITFITNAGIFSVFDR
jgi:hypothetical protein